MLLGALYPGGSCGTPGGEWAAPLSPTRVPAGRACVLPGRCQGPYNGAPGRDARPAHSAPNNHCSAAAGPAVSRGGRTGGQQMGLGCRISSPVGAAQAGAWGGVGSSLPASGSSQPLLPEGGWEGQGGRWGRGLSGHHHCPLEQGGGETGPTPGLSRGVGFSSVRGILRRLDSGPTAIGEAHRTTLGLSFLVRTTGVHLRRIHGALASCRARLRAPEK